MTWQWIMRIYIYIYLKCMRWSDLKTYNVHIYFPISLYLCPFTGTLQLFSRTWLCTSPCYCCFSLSQGVLIQILPSLQPSTSGHFMMLIQAMTQTVKGKSIQVTCGFFQLVQCTKCICLGCGYFSNLNKE